MAGGWRARIAGAVAGTLAAVSSVAPPLAHAWSAPIVYVALGDSIASGYGLGTTALNADGTPSCQRSSGLTPAQDAYTDRIWDFLGGNGRSPAASAYFKLACAGATTQDVLSGQVPLAAALVGQHPALITLTAGADDLQFTNPLAYALAFDPDTYESYSYLRLLEGIQVYRDVLLTLRALGQGQPQRHLVVTGYYDPFNPGSVVFTAFDSLFARSGWDCEHGFGQRPTCAALVGDTVLLLNGALQGAVRDYDADGAANAPATFVPVEGAFATHGSPSLYCGTGPPGFNDSWIQALPDPPASNGQLNVFDPPDHGDDCFHPNPRGHQAIARLVERRLAGPGEGPQ